MDHVGLDDCRGINFLNWFLSDIYPVVDDQQRIGCSQHFIIQGNSIQVLFEEGLEHLVVLIEGVFLFGDGQSIEQDFIVPLEEVV